MTDWQDPRKPGLPQARCTQADCTPQGVPGLLCVAVTLVDGTCVQCRRSPAMEDEQRLRLDV